jgi:hypothetical protein
MKLQRKSTIKNNRKNGNRKKKIIREKTRENLRGGKELEKKPKRDGGEKKTIHGNVNCLGEKKTIPTCNDFT